MLHQLRSQKDTTRIYLAREIQEEYKLKESIYRNYEDLPLMLNAKQIGVLFGTSISKQAYRAKGGMTAQPPKTDYSIRKISLSAETMELLKQEHNKHPSNPYLFPVAVPGVFVARHTSLESRRPASLRNY